MCCFFASSLLSGTVCSAENAVSMAPVYIDIDGRTAIDDENKSWQGLSASLTGGTAQLLLDYKTDSPDSYEELLELLFGENGAGITSVKAEIGCDINSFAGTEPAVSRDNRSFPDVSASPSWQTAADAKRICPSLTVEMIRTGDPKYVTDEFAKSEEAGMKARFDWYMSCLDAVYEKFGIVPDIICADAEESVKSDFDWIIYLSESLKNVQSREYSCTDIKISAVQYPESSSLTDEMNGDPRLMHAVDIIDYCDSGEYGINEEILANEYGKEIRCTEGGVPAEASEYSESLGSGSVMDTAANMISAFSSQMTSYEFKPAVSAYYSGMKYFPCGLIGADTPWNGSFSVGSGLYAAAQFTAFAENGWQFVESACGSTYMTLTSPENGDSSTVIVNNSPSERVCTIRRAYISTMAKPLNIWQTADGHRLKHLGTAENDFSGGSYISELTVPPYSITTLTTSGSSPEITVGENDSHVLALPYADSFDYSDEYMYMHGGSAKYSCTESGAFLSENGRLIQQVTADSKPAENGSVSVPDPVLTLGDINWHDYSVSAKVSLADESSDNYAGIGLRSNSSASYGGLSHSGYILRINGGGTWNVLDGSDVIGGGKIKDYASGSDNTLKISAEGRLITAYINGEQVFSAEMNVPYVSSGRVLLCSGYYRNSFDDLTTEPVGGSPYSSKIDATDSGISYSGNVRTESEDSYTYFDRSYAFMDSGRYIVPTELYSKKSAVDIASADYDRIEINGSGAGECTIFIDGSPAEQKRSGYTAKADIPAGEHSIHINLPTDGTIENITLIKADISEKTSFEFDFTGGFSLIGQNDGGALIEVGIDGKTHETAELIQSDTREAFYTYTSPDSEAHHAVITLKSGSLLLDSAEIYPNDMMTVSHENDVEAASTERYYTPPITHEVNEESAEDTAEVNSEASSGSVSDGLIAIVSLALAYAAIEFAKKKLLNK